MRAMASVDLGAPDPRLAPLLASYPAEVFSERLYLSCELVDRYAGECALAVAHALGLESALRQPATPATVGRRAGLVAGFEPALTWLLERLAADGEIGAVTEFGELRFRLGAPLRAAQTGALREQGLALDPANAATLTLFDAAAAAYPRVAHGARGEELLFSPGQVGLWGDYFSAANPVYAINNSLAAHAVTRAVAERGGAVRVLEVGAGAGSATLAVLAALAARGLLGALADYAATEPSTFFRRRAERALRARFPTVPLRFTALDIDQDWPRQGAATATFDLVLGVNVFHAARRLMPALEAARGALAPGGALVLGECLRLSPDQPVAAEFPFLLLDGFTRVETDPELRPRPGFLEPGQWRAVLERAGFASVAVEPDLDRIRDFYPRFNAGALTARRA